MARVKDYWIYQERRKSVPWAIHLFATKDGRKTRCDFDMYAEWIPNASKRLTVKNVSIWSVKDEVQRICASLDMPFEKEDAGQIKSELMLMLSDM